MVRKLNLDLEYQSVPLINNRNQILQTKNIVAYCHCDTHKGFISKSLMKQHGCIAKNCPFFDKSVNPIYWNNVAHTKDERKEKRKQRKERLKKLYEGVVE